MKNINHRKGFQKCCQLEQHPHDTVIEMHIFQVLPLSHLFRCTDLPTPQKALSSQSFVLLLSWISVISHFPAISIALSPPPCSLLLLNLILPSTQDTISRCALIAGSRFFMRTAVLLRGGENNGSKFCFYWSAASPTSLSTAPSRLCLLLFLALTCQKI